ncbi:unnamed protein product [Heterotrigona itama]|uniref:Uncharacterized protein n=1 Tax=Heterotrigona itama TaxID=395501 RepID=A0A6V7HHS8_9HYME|nr:unnamed protein product [Heterotrigona itama]
MTIISRRRSSTPRSRNHVMRYRTKAERRFYRLLSHTKLSFERKKLRRTIGTKFLEFRCLDIPRLIGGLSSHKIFDETQTCLYDSAFNGCDDLRGRITQRSSKQLVLLALSHISHYQGVSDTKMIRAGLDFDANEMAYGTSWIQLRAMKVRERTKARKTLVFHL